MGLEKSWFIHKKMSADHITVKDVIEQLQKFPEDMLVVGFGIDGWQKGEKLDGVEIYKHPVHEYGDGFVPVDPKKADWREIKEHVIGGDTEVVVISPISPDILLQWCDLED